MEMVRAAGGVLWRPGRAGSLVAVVHRPRRGDWSLPKGKLRTGEGWEEAALREVEEETGCTARLAAFAGSTLHESRRGPKLVLYWHMVLVREGTLRGAEVDEVRWLSPDEAQACLDRGRERRLLDRALRTAPAVGHRTSTYPRALRGLAAP